MNTIYSSLLIKCRFIWKFVEILFVYILSAAASKMPLALIKPLSGEFEFALDISEILSIRCFERDLLESFILLVMVCSSLFSLLYLCFLVSANSSKGLVLEVASK